MNPGLIAPDVTRAFVALASIVLGCVFLTLGVAQGLMWLGRYFNEWPKRRAARQHALMFPLEQQAYDLGPMGAAGRKDDARLPLLERDTASARALAEWKARASAPNAPDAMRQIAESAHDSYLTRYRETQDDAENVA